MLRKVLVLFFHPRFEDSIVNKTLVNAVQNLPGTTFHDVYECYPDFDIDIRSEQSLLLEHDIIVWHHPFYWYSCPPLMKQWIDLVLEYGWAYGKDGRQLQGKYVFNCLTAGGSQEVYREGGRNRFRVTEFLRPFEQTAHLCQMHYLPPFVVHHANLATRPECLRFATAYKDLLNGLVDGSVDPAQIAPTEYINSHMYPTLL